jgi:hypothetical protein
MLQITLSGIHKVRTASAGIYVNPGEFGYIESDCHHAYRARFNLPHGIVWLQAAFSCVVKFFGQSQYEL